MKILELLFRKPWWTFYEGKSPDPDNEIIKLYFSGGVGGVKCVNDLLMAFVMASGNTKAFCATNGKLVRKAWPDEVNDEVA